jgi:predicted ATPase
LVTDNWDDFGYKTLYHLLYVDGEGETHRIGGVKIAHFALPSADADAVLPQRFETLSSLWFSLGQDDTYYERLNQLGAEVRVTILQSLRDLALDLDTFQRAIEEEVTGVSLLRSVSVASVRNQFHRLAQGGARLSLYSFSYSPPRSARTRTRSPVLTFAVDPASEPPTNIHVLIGRNGVGKTRLLQFMASAVVIRDPDEEFGHFASDETDNSPFAGLVSVSFSAFDSFEPLPERRNKAKGPRYSYIGLKRRSGADSAAKDPAQLSSDFVKSVRLCRQGARASRWLRALQTLEADPLFSATDVASLARTGDVDQEDTESDDFAKRAAAIFGQLSSGHKIVLLTITRLVETVQERTLVLIDEPEAHLHPPLLSAFTRALSDLMMNRNGVAIIATHSPVLLQEVPKRCVWKIRRSGPVSDAERPEIETFGENVGILTREVFGLEVTQSGFHRLLEQAMQEERRYSNAVDRFGGQLGSEALALLRSIEASRRGPSGRH